ncbi:hypothetical protein INT47_004733 [Mucor saturninus]|uniref:Uncharacterized protein n=1 Tax=Mucor saturninus TaxID=64648 RepID=A0A8H7UW39_9FUNG|nr:hypothetical protein INT47_004733 [Mucor saturninus]
MDGSDQIEYIVGIGTTTSGVSIAHVNDPFIIITVIYWDDLSKDPQKFPPSVLYLEDQNNTPLCGTKAEDVSDLGVYVANIDASNRKLGQLMDGLTVKKVITDYLKYFVQLALKRLQTFICHQRCRRSSLPAFPGQKCDQNYFVGDVADIFIGVAKIHADSTEALSVITNIFDDTTLGLINVAIKFKDYLIDNMTIEFEYFTQ